MNKDEMKQVIESEIIDKLIDGIEVNILQQRDDLLKLGVEFAKAVANEKFSGRMNFSKESDEHMKKIREKYQESIRNMDKDTRLHNYVVKNPDKIGEFLKGWLSTENYELVRFNNYIEDTFRRKELDELEK